MSDKKNKSPKNNKSPDTARKIWLAGIGAYGRAFSEVQEGLSKATKGTSKVFDELVEKGEVLETIVTHKSKEAFDKVSDKLGDKMGDGFDIDDRISAMRSRLKRGNNHDNDMEARLDVIEAKLDEVLKLLKPKKTTPKKKAATRKKPAAKK
ncbi:MAG: hypothetical protein COC03_07710 [Robiginitomaculum sp.]|nr:MAG: hypothetical protein COC03_07710 [Robiginitomaculum sp.]